MWRALGGAYQSRRPQSGDDRTSAMELLARAEEADQ